MRLCFTISLTLNTILYKFTETFSCTDKQCNTILGIEASAQLFFLKHNSQRNQGKLLKTGLLKRAQSSNVSSSGLLLPANRLWSGTKSLLPWNQEDPVTASVAFTLCLVFLCTESATTLVFRRVTANWQGRDCIWSTHLPCFHVYCISPRSQFCIYLHSRNREAKAV